MTSIERLYVPSDLRSGPNCGVTAVAILAGVSFAEAWKVLRKIKKASRRWKGGTNAKDRQLALEHFGVKFNAYTLHDRRRLDTWIRDRAEPGKIYMLRTTGHVQVVLDGWVIDQRGLVRIERYDMAKKLLTHVVEVL